MPHSIKFLCDFLPLIGFFIVYKLAGIFPATLCLVGLTLASLALTYAWERRVSVMALASAVIVSVLGGLTYWLQNEDFIKIKPTLIGLGLAFTLWLMQRLGKNPMKAVIGMSFQLTEKGWRLLTHRWIAFFIGLALMNEWAWRTLPTESWLNVKVFGFTLAAILFSVLQAPLITRHQCEEEV